MIKTKNNNKRLKIDFVRRENLLRMFEDIAEVYIKQNKDQVFSFATMTDKRLKETFEGIFDLPPKHYEYNLIRCVVLWIVSRNDESIDYWGKMMDYYLTLLIEMNEYQKEVRDLIRL